MAESTGLLNLHTGNRITSSNLVLSAKKVLQKFLRDLFWVTEPVEVTSLYTDCGLYYVYYQMISYLSLVGLR